MTERTPEPPKPRKDNTALTREERLAQRLRENLRLRKAQARALNASQDTVAEPPAHS